jgi:hypothetical protein
MQRKAHTVKPGDKIEGREVFDTLRRGFSGWYIPLSDGSRYPVQSRETIVKTDD